MQAIRTNKQLLSISLAPAIRAVDNWFAKRLAEHYQKCADVEHRKAKEARENARYYEARAAFIKADVGLQ